MNFYKNEYQNGHKNESGYKAEVRDDYNGGRIIKEECQKEYQGEIREQNEMNQYRLGNTEPHRSEDSDEQEEDRSEGDSYSSYSPSSSQDSQNDDSLNQKLNQIDRQQTVKNTDNSLSRAVHVRETIREVNGTNSSISSKMTGNVSNAYKKITSNQPTTKPPNQKAILSISSLKCTEHVRNNLTNLNHLSPTTLKISLKSNKSFAVNGSDEASGYSSLGRNELARSHQPSSFNQNEEKMDTSTNETSHSSSSNESDEDSLGNSPESQSDEDQTDNRKIWRPDFFRDRMEFANQVVITQIRDPQSKSIITFKESRKTFPKLS